MSNEKNKKSEKTENVDSSAKATAPKVEMSEMTKKVCAAVAKVKAKAKYDEKPFPMVMKDGKEITLAVTRTVDGEDKQVLLEGKEASALSHERRFNQLTSKIGKIADDALHAKALESLKKFFTPEIPVKDMNEKQKAAWGKKQLGMTFSVLEEVAAIYKSAKKVGGGKRKIAEDEVVEFEF